MLLTFAVVDGLQAVFDLAWHRVLSTAAGHRGLPAAAVVCRMADSRLCGLFRSAKRITHRACILSSVLRMRQVAAVCQPLESAGDELAPQLVSWQSISFVAYVPPPAHAASHTVTAPAAVCLKLPPTSLTRPASSIGAALSEIRVAIIATLDHGHATPVKARPARAPSFDRRGVRLRVAHRSGKLLRQRCVSFDMRSAPLYRREKCNACRPPRPPALMTSAQLICSQLEHSQGQLWLRIHQRGPARSELPWARQGASACRHWRLHAPPCRRAGMWLLFLIASHPSPPAVGTATRSAATRQLSRTGRCCFLLR